jgi:small subunit ribosomal protein S20
MPNIKSAAKRAGQAEVRRLRNRSAKSSIATAKRVFLAAVESKDKKNAMDKFKALCSILDKSAKRGIITKNTADRGKARASAAITKMA